MPQGVGADLIATLDGFSRADVDAYAVESQRRAAAAWAEGRFARSIVPVKDVLGRVMLDRDEHMRPDATVQSLAALKPSFAAIGEQGGFDAVAQMRYPQVETINHVHTAANSSGIVDGAAAVLIGSKRFGAKAGLKPRARMRAFTSIGSEPAIMLTGPGARDAEAAEARGHDVVQGHRPVRGQRGVRLGGAALHARDGRAARQGQRERRRHRHGPSARRHRRGDRSASCSTNSSAAT